MALIGIAAASRPLAYFLVGVAWLFLIGLVAYKGIYQGRYLPQFVLDYIDRAARTRRDAERKDAKLNAIDAEELAAKLKARVAGQDQPLTRSHGRSGAASQPGDRTNRWRYSALPGHPGSARRILPRSSETLYGDPKHLHFIDMSQNSGTTLFGSPRGHMGSESYGQVTSALRTVPNSVVRSTNSRRRTPTFTSDSSPPGTTGS